MSAEMRARLAAQRAQETDPVRREAYALIERMGGDWFDTESQARRVAEHAAGDIVALRKLVEALVLHLEYCGWGDKWEREVSAELRDSLPQLLRDLGVRP